MYTTNKLYLTNKAGIHLGLTFCFSDVIELYDAVENSESVNQLVHEVNETNTYSVWNLNRDTNKYTRLVTEDYCGNVRYLYVYKEQ